MAAATTIEPGHADGGDVHGRTRRQFVSTFFYHILSEKVRRAKSGNYANGKRRRERIYCYARNFARTGIFEKVRRAKSGNHENGKTANGIASEKYCYTRNSARTGRFVFFAIRQF